MRSLFARLVLLLGLVIGTLVLLYSILHPSEPENARLFGFSYLRLFLMTLILGLLTLTAVMSWRAFRDETWLEMEITRLVDFFYDRPIESVQVINEKSNSQSILRRDWLQLGVLFILALVIFIPISYRVVFSMPTSDFPTHIYIAEVLGRTGRPELASDISHAGWQVMVILIQAAARTPFAYAGFIATVLGQAMMVFLVYLWVRPALTRQALSVWWGVLLSLGVNLAAPVILLVREDMRLYYGYVGMATYHNPTIILLRPFALIQFIFTIRGLSEPRSSWKMVIPVAFISAYAAYIKPSFAICLLPALGLILLIRLLKQQKINWGILGVGIIFPTVAVLVWQFLLTYSSGEGAGIIFMPFGVLSQFSGWLLEKFLLSILFPLLVLVLYFRKVIRDTRLQLAWLTFAAGTFCTYFLAESGLTFLHGNFTWSGEVSTLVLFCTSTLFFLEQVRINQFKTWLFSIVWSFHVLSGLLYYLRLFIWKDYS